MVTTYNHAFTLGFSIGGSTHSTGEDITGQDIRHKLIKRLEGMSNEEILENVGAPFDTYEEIVE